MDFGVSLGSNLKIGNIAEHSKVAEENGFSHLGFVDQPFHDRDAWVSMTIAAMNTSSILIGQTVTDPFTYHPLVIANATATVNELSEGRAFVGIGAGGAGAKAIFKPVPLNELRDAVVFIQQVTSGMKGAFKGVWEPRTRTSEMHSVWIRDRIPVYWAADGLKSAEMAGEVADGVIFSGGHPELTKMRLEHVEKGALKAGRDPSEIDIWLRSMIFLSDSKEEAMPEVASFAATQANATYRFALKNPEVGKLLEKIDPGIVDEFRKVSEAYAHYDHERPGAIHGNVVSKKVIDFFHLTGNLEDVCEGIYKVEQLRAQNGLKVKCLGLAMFTIKDQIGMMREIGSQVIPLFKT